MSEISETRGSGQEDQGHTGPGSSMKDQDLSPRSLFNQIRRIIIEATMSQELVYESIGPEAGSLITDSLHQDGEVERARPRIHYNSYTQTLRIRIMPTFIHDALQLWIRSEMLDMVLLGFITRAEHKGLHINVGTTITGFSPPYALSEKEPDLCFLPVPLTMPTIVIETSWSESFAKLRGDMRLWLIGGGGAVEMVLLVKWTKLIGTNQVKGAIEVYTRNPAGVETLIQTEVIFPTPAPAAVATQQITITRGQLWGSAIPAGRNPNNTYNLSLDSLRQDAIEELRKMGLQPAT